MTELELAYIAGFFDGEGDCRVRQVKSSNGKRYSRVDARISQNDKEILNWIKECFGGSIYLKKDNRRESKNHALMFSYRKARIFLTAIEPYARVKREKITSVLNEVGRLTS